MNLRQRRDDAPYWIPCMRYYPPQRSDIWFGALLVSIVILLGVLS